MSVLPARVGWESMISARMSSEQWFWVKSVSWVSFNFDRSHSLGLALGRLPGEYSLELTGAVYVDPTNNEMEHRDQSSIAVMETPAL